MCLLVTEFRFDAMLCSYLSKENSDAGHIKCSRGPQIPTPGLRLATVATTIIKPVTAVAEKQLSVCAESKHMTAMQSIDVNEDLSFIA